MANEETNEKHIGSKIIGFFKTVVVFAFDAKVSKQTGQCSNKESQQLFVRTGTSAESCGILKKTFKVIGLGKILIFIQR